MSVKYAPSKLRVPEGFQNVLEGLAREVLREQPEDIILFAANYFKNQLALQENGNAEPVDQPVKSEASVASKKDSVASKKDSVASKKDSVASKKDSVASKKTSVVAQETDVQPQDDQDVTSADAIVEPNAVEEDSSPAEDEPKQTDVEETSEPQPSMSEEDAALKIQSVIRGNKAREEVNALKAASETDVATEPAAGEETEKQDTQIKDAVASTTEETADESTIEEQEAAALKIQASFRGHQARKEVDNMKAESKLQVSDAENADADKPVEEKIEETEAVVNETEPENQSNAEEKVETNEKDEFAAVEGEAVDSAATDSEQPQMQEEPKETGQDDSNQEVGAEGETKIRGNETQADAETEKTPVETSNPEAETTDDTPAAADETNTEDQAAGEVAVEDAKPEDETPKDSEPTNANTDNTEVPNAEDGNQDSDKNDETNKDESDDPAKVSENQVEAEPTKDNDKQDDVESTKDSEKQDNSEPAKDSEKQDDSEPAKVDSDPVNDGEAEASKEAKNSDNDAKETS